MKRIILFIAITICFYTLYSFAQALVPSQNQPIPPPPILTEQQFEQLLGESYGKGYMAGIHYHDAYIASLQKRIIELSTQLSKQETKP